MKWGSISKITTRNKIGERMDYLSLSSRVAPASKYSKKSGEISISSVCTEGLLLESENKTEECKYCLKRNDMHLQEWLLG